MKMSVSILALLMLLSIGVKCSRFKSAILRYRMTQYMQNTTTLIRECRVRVYAQYTVEQSNQEGKTSTKCDGDFRKHGLKMSEVFKEIGLEPTYPILQCVNDQFCSRKGIKDAIKLNGACTQGHEAFGQLTFWQKIDYRMPCDSSIRLVYLPGSNLFVFGGKDASISAHMSKSSAFLYMTIMTMYRTDREINSSPHVAVVPQYLVAHSVTEPLIVSVFDPNKGDTIKCRWPIISKDNITECVHPDSFNPSKAPSTYTISESSCAIKQFLDGTREVNVKLFENCSLSAYFPSTFIGRTYHIMAMVEDYKSGESNPMSVVPFAFMLRVTSSTETRRARLIYGNDSKIIKLKAGQEFKQNLTCETFCPKDALKCVQTLTRISILPYPEYVSVSELKSTPLNSTWQTFFKVLIAKPKNHHCNSKRQICAYCSDAYSHSHINCQIYEVTHDSNSKLCLPNLLEARCHHDEIYCGRAYNDTCVRQQKVKEECLKCDVNQCSKDQFCSAHTFDCEQFAQKGCLKKTILCGEARSSFLDRSGEIRERRGATKKAQMAIILMAAMALLITIILLITCCALLRNVDQSNSYLSTSQSTDSSTERTSQSDDDLPNSGGKINVMQAADEEELT